MVQFHWSSSTPEFTTEFSSSPLNLSLSQQENTQTLGAAGFKPIAVQTERSRMGKIRRTKETAYTTHWLHTGHPLAQQVKPIKLNGTKWNCASHPLGRTHNVNKIDVSPPLATSKPPTTATTITNFIENWKITNYITLPPANSL